MDPLEIARWQFGITTVYHFIMVPLTLGLGPIVALMQTQWVRTGDEKWLRMTKFWGKLYLINFIMGVATGLVQEFQFGMAWSEYSRFVGDVFGAPLAMEGLLAFFFESVFLGLWIFGWDRLGKKLHLATLWIAVAGSVVSAFFIIVANSWMQHPVGVELIDGRPVMTDIWAVLTNNTALSAYSHTITGAIAVGAGFVVGISWYQLWQRRRDGIDTVDATGRVVVGENLSIPGRDRKDHAVWIKSIRIGAVIAVLGFGALSITGDLQAKLMFEQQPLKMAAAEAACHDGTSFSVLSIGPLGGQNCDDVVGIIEIPGLLSFLAHGDFDTEIKGVNTLIPEYQALYGTNLPDDPLYGERAGQEIEYLPLMEVTYWGFRLMIGFGALAAGFALLTLWIVRKGTVPRSKFLMGTALLSIAAPFGANIAGWVFTEMGRQPFVVAPNPNPSGVDGVFMFTAAAVSPGVSGEEMIFSLASLALVYGFLLVFEIKLLVKYVRGGVASAMPELAHPDGEGHDGTGSDPDDPNKPDKRDDVLAFAY
ncbi:cytochrome bd-I ubiquinol oxidase subunit 1 apoprotein [Salinibacterium amurskyense]|uniref:Cytochrome bd-I ubiquinol oxidase subunit 1 apoprotein n=1 Tax=Salinibacterium amurskyense TaxID=205941 RepID=A0A2M9D5M2_9MICO|nr:cytochrome ubiquinol oxidase subunit I [Salinibacterium amurskyense]PJJ80918.1 cytochrome bd-I ubiquinol oxidase subunit 1 apoprotein [Salinibacterium amurskyense]RLQ82962.1 cytochrome ubiquinol oxidase subunit I [Salinibacterium amurskyense]GHD82058.1 cytochrome ubiquinol oxidase subunit I [Salinibacterium amurskyense]